MSHQQLARLPGCCVLSGGTATNIAEFRAYPKVMSWWWLVLVPFGPPAWIVIAVVYVLRRAANREQVRLPVAVEAYDKYNRTVRTVRVAAAAVLVGAVAGVAATWELDPGTARTAIQVAAGVTTSLALLIVSVGSGRTPRFRIVGGDVVIRNAHRSFSDELR